MIQRMVVNLEQVKEALGGYKNCCVVQRRLRLQGYLCWLCGVYAFGVTQAIRL